MSERDVVTFRLCDLMKDYTEKLSEIQKELFEWSNITRKSEMERRQAAHWFDLTHIYLKQVFPEIEALIRVVSQFVEHGVKQDIRIVELRLRMVDLEATKQSLEVTMEHIGR